MNWLASRQTDNLGEEDDENEDEDENENEDETKSSDEKGAGTETGSVAERVLALPSLTEIAGDTIACAGFNGRCNKVADTCYSFWNGATLLVSISSVNRSNPRSPT